MKPIYTLFMVSLLVALGAYIFFFEREAVAPNTPAQTASKAILTLERSEIETLELSQNAPAESIVLEKKDGKWYFDGHIADPGRIENILQQLTPWQSSRVLEKHFDLKRAEEFGLKTPDLILRIKHAGQESTLQIGSQTPSNTGYYVTRTGSPELYLSYVNVPEDLRRLLTNPPLAKTADTNENKLPVSSNSAQRP